MRELQLVPDLKHSAYTEQVKMRGYNCKPSVLTAVTPEDAGRILSKVMPAWTKSDHKNLAIQHARASSALDKRHSKLLDDAAFRAWGRPFEVTDYKITAIGSDAFPEDIKEELRFAAYGSTNHRKIARAHLAASK